VVTGAAPLVAAARQRTKATQFYPTPAEAIEEMIELACLNRRHTVLEPSAGSGAIAAVLAGRVAAVDCVEIEPDFAEVIRGAGYARTLTVGDFLKMTPSPVYDRVIMNPPFARGQDAKHVLHALKWVRPGGRLLTVLPDMIQRRYDRNSRAVQAAVNDAYGIWEPLPDDTFKDFGVKIRTVIAVIPVLESGRANPATRAPGTYIEDGVGGRDRMFRFSGLCIGCGRRTWAHDDGHDDRRGMFGQHTNMRITEEDLRSQVDGAVPDDIEFPQCGACWDTAGTYETSVRLAAAKFRLDRASAADATSVTVQAALDTLEQISLFDVA
jgi:predicted RNA methylase